MYFDTELKVVTFAPIPFAEPVGEVKPRYIPISIPMPEGNDWQWDGSKWYQDIEPSTQPVPDEISRRQFFQYLAVLGIISGQEALAALQSGAIPAPLQAIIDQLPTEDDQFEAQMFIIGAQNFNRLHPLSDTVRLALEWTVEQKDDFWREAYKL